MNAVHGAAESLLDGGGVEKVCREFCGLWLRLPMPIHRALQDLGVGGHHSLKDDLASLSLEEELGIFFQPGGLEVGDVVADALPQLDRVLILERMTRRVSVVT